MKSFLRVHQIEMLCKMYTTINAKKAKDTFVDDLVKSPKLVTPAQVGVQNILKLLDSGLRRNDGRAVF